MIISEPSSTLLDRLGTLCSDRGLADLAHRLDELAALVGDDMTAIERSLRDLGGSGSIVEASARTLVELGGKRLRPLCVVLAARVGSGFTPAVLDLAIAAELTHNATLLHDDVVDLAERRRGSPTARVEYGNAASIFAGDWLLVEALRRVRRAGSTRALDALLDVIDEMILAESLQLERRGDLEQGRDHYLQVASGKSASLFRWALEAGAYAGGLNASDCQTLGGYGIDLGLAFQIVDDLLDVTGSPGATGKALFNDLREGKMTLPLIIALERDPSLRVVLREFVEESGLATDTVASAELIDALRKTGAFEESRTIALEHTRRAVAKLASLPSGPALTALEGIAETLVDRAR